jgi:hypothetical protein
LDTTGFAALSINLLVLAFASDDEVLGAAMVLKYLIEAYILRLQGPSELGVEFAEQAVSAPIAAIRHDSGNLPTEFGYVA